MKVTTLKGIFPDPKPLRRKNFIHENVKSLRRMEQCFQANKEVEELQKLQLHKYHKTMDKYQNISARVVTNFQKKKKHQGDNTSIVLKNNINVTLTDRIEDKKQQSQDESNILKSNAKHIAIPKKIFRAEINSNLSSKQQKQGGTSKYNEKYSQQKMQSKVSSEPNIVHKFDNTINKTDIQNAIKYKNQGMQTLNIDQMENIYSEGIIRYPSEKITKHNDAVSDTNLNEQEEKTIKLQINSPKSRDNMHSPEDLRKLDLRSTVSQTHREVDQLNKEYTSVVDKPAIQLNHCAPPAHYRKGVVPKYLRERKEVQQKELKAKKEASYSDCPENHVPLPDHERKETLQLLKKNYQEYINELNMMPIKTDTLRAQRRKMEIEKQLNKLEEGIKVFSRPKVFVKMNA
ncbi:uncharacterized protein LOC116846823 isoform X2 [Odontomachus brunneus]|uniref:uncharacterized protein LOC116846823 isoform X2 n=1 Tax=Odontomachus brunneus TaxID=486640 RepID=UPI0013F1DEF7|nr:uncharacterized protein LOC116846823 isoform X2 [Odontomachus brunneus]